MPTIIHISDIHGDSAHVEFLKTAIDREVAAARAQGEQVILVHAGDFAGANRLLSSHSAGRFDAEVTAELLAEVDEDYRFFVPGNHDGMYGKEGLQKFLAETRLQTVVTNATLHPDYADMAADTPKQRIITLASADAEDAETAATQIAILGAVTSTSTQQFVHIQNLEETAKSIAAQMAELHAQGINDFIIASHLGQQDDELLAKKLLEREDIEFRNLYILGGHSHTITPRALAITSADGNKTIHVTNAGFDGRHFISLDLDPATLALRDEGAFILHEPSPADTETAAAITSIITTHKVQFMERHPEINLDQKVLQVGGQDLSGLELFEHEYAATPSHLRVNDSWITRKTADIIKEKSGADFSLLPAAAFRNNFCRDQDVTYQDLYEMYFAGNRIAVIEVSGEDIVRALAFGLRESYQHWFGRGTLMHPSAQLSYSYDCSEGVDPSDCITDITFQGEPLDLRDTYRVAVTDWMLRKNFFPTAARVVTPDSLAGKQICDLMYEHLAANPEESRRIQRWIAPASRI